MTKERLDRLLVEKGLVPTRTKAFAAILAGEVSVDGETCYKPDRLFSQTVRVEYRKLNPDYVSRGGYKLEKALDQFGFDVKGLVVLDAGASTGGFTDCLLKRGAGKVIGVDVGYGQLAWELRNHDRVELHERVNLRYLKPEDISGPPDLATLDLSFISLTKVMPAVVDCLKENGVVLALVKPQFEAGKGQVPRSGVIKDPDIHTSVLSGLGRRFVSDGMSVLGMTFSPIKGAEGNIEYWLYLSKTASLGYPIKDVESLAQSVVKDAHRDQFE